MRRNRALIMQDLRPMHPTERRISQLTLAAVTLWLLLCAIQPHMPVNPASRLAAIQALVEQGTWAIDGVSLGSMTIDKVFLGDHFYSSKPPVLNLLGAALYAIIKPVTGWTFDTHLFQLGSLFGVLLGTVPWLLGVLLFHRLLRMTVASWQVRTVSMVAITLSSLATAYGATFNNHVVGFVLIFAMWERWSPAFRGEALSGSRLALGALAGSFAIACELTSGAVVAASTALLLPAIYRDRTWGRLAWLGLLLASLPLVQVAVHWSQSGSPIPIQFQDPAWKYPGSYWKNPVEFDALNEPLPVYAFHSLFGHHGLFSLTPWLLLSAGWFAARPTETRERAAWYAGWFILVAMVGFYLYRTNNYGGRCVGFRWFILLQPMMFLAAARVLDREGPVLRRPVLLGLLIGAGAISALGGAINPWEEGLVHAIFRAIGAGSVDG
jgi:hypothetical protein